ncbi:Bardet-Biedl syndrome 7 protein homolog [Macrosteles quadrilineatus]|uniref:Bardet-Biedl syndrome 7 protein homolog n=1 Tax=Macrosteles quadrilineatus TaxID=74068 RepID=UPI0023E11848|nr:Bardet-Biedl syndrome 7 protein homolog [Macrosteles quadrilineatus]
MELTRVDYTLLGLTSPHCMKLLPNNIQKMAQKVAVGDHDGVVQLFSLKRGEIQLGFKTLPGDKITRLLLGGALGTPQDKIFVSSKNEVRGYTKKGKLFLGFETNLTETIQSMAVSASDLMVCGSQIYNHYRDCKDADSYLSADHINDVIALSAEKLHRLTPVLACEDRMLRVLDHSTLVHSFPLAGVPTVLHLYNNDGSSTGDQLLYGTDDGSIGLVQITKAGVSAKWRIEPGKHRGGVQCLYCYDMTGDGVPDLLVGRSDGTVQIYSIPVDDADDLNQPSERFSHVSTESVTAIQGGVVGNNGFDEVLVTTYTGWFFGLTTEVIDKQMSGEGGDLNTKVKISNDDKLKIVRLRTEIEELEQRLVKERERYNIASLEDGIGISTIPFFNVTDKMTLVKDTAVYQLMIEVETAIDNILLQSDVPLDLLDVDKNSAVLSRSACAPGSDNQLLATYRCQMNTTRLELCLRTTEGVAGTLCVYITAVLQPKCCQLRRHQIKPLSLHTRCHQLDVSRSFNSLGLKGNFSLAEMHSWVSHCLPEVPEKPPLEDKVSYIFTSTLMHSMLHCTYSKGEAEFRSDNVSTICILKDFITKEATKKKIKLEISIDINDDSAASLLRRLDSRLSSEVVLARQVGLLEALRELETVEGRDLLSPEYQQILDNQKQLLERYNSQPGYLARFTDLFAARDSGRCSSLIMLDYSQALDSISHGLLLSKLRHFGFGDVAISWLRSYLGNRSQVTRMGVDTSPPLKKLRGVPQGSCLGPILFTL